MMPGFAPAMLGGPGIAPSWNCIFGHGRAIVHQRAWLKPYTDRVVA